MLRSLLLTFTFAISSHLASAATLHIDVTPDLAGDNGVIMKPLDKNTTRFTIRTSATIEPKSADAQFPFVRRGYLNVRSEHGRILRCNLRPKKQGGELLYVFDLENEHAKCSSFELVEHFDDGQVGGGKVFTYRLINFIDPSHSALELTQGIRPQDLSIIQFKPDLLPPDSVEP